jgi:hypothetical protein
MFHTRLIIVVAFVAIAFAGCGLSPEATFTLAPESRLPSWFQLPPGQSRANVIVSMSYFVRPNGRSARFVMYGSHGETIQKVTGKLSGLALVVAPGSSNGYPSYEVIAVNGAVEVVEHRAMEPIVYVTDDVDVLKKLMPRGEVVRH